jgi:hypothetical protein
MTDNIQGRRDTHLDIPLDDDQPVMSREPVFVDVVAKSAEVKPIIPASFRSWSNLKAWTSYQAGLNARRAGYHAARTLQIYLPLMLFWSVVGVFRLANRQRLWWWQPQMTALLDEAVAKGDLHAGPKINRDLSEQRKARFFALLAELVALAVAVVLLWALAPRWAQVAAVVLALPWLAHVGRPQTMPILRPPWWRTGSGGSTPTSCCAPTTRPGSATRTSRTSRSRSPAPCSATSGRPARRWPSTCRSGCRSPRSSRRKRNSRPAWTSTSTRCSSPGQDVQPAAPAVRRRP